MGYIENIYFYYKSSCFILVDVIKQQQMRTLIKGMMRMQLVQKAVRVIIQAAIIMCITYVGNVLQQFFHIPIAGSIVGLILFFVLLQLKVIPPKWIDEGANFFLTTMVFFFIPSVVGVMDIFSEINMNFILFFSMILIGTCCVALLSGFIADKMVCKWKYGNGDS